MTHYLSDAPFDPYSIEGDDGRQERVFRASQRLLGGGTTAAIGGATPLPTALLRFRHRRNSCNGNSAHQIIHVAMGEDRIFWTAAESASPSALQPEHWIYPAATAITWRTRCSFRPADRRWGRR